MKNKGFTLIELLAVIVILAIIALIAVPIVLNIIEDVKEESNQRSMELYAKAVENAMAKYYIKNESKLTGYYEESNSGKILTNSFNSSMILQIGYNGNVKCNTIEIYEDHTFYLSECTINNSEKEYSWGNKKQIPKTIAQYITDLYTPNGTVDNNSITYNLDTINLLMNDRLGGTTEDYDAGNIRYYGKTPNNYIDIGDKDSSGNTILWRIIGVFKDMQVPALDDNTTIMQDLVKIVRNDSVGSYSWDNKKSGTGSSSNNYGSNKWMDSRLMMLLNPPEDTDSIIESNSKIYKYERGLYWNSKIGTCYSGSTDGTVACDFTSSGLSSQAKIKVENVIWHVQGSNYTGYYSNDVYKYERGMILTSGSPTTWIGKIALIYPSDYGYATDFTKCDVKLQSYDDSTDSYACRTNDWIYDLNYQWFLAPYTSQTKSVFHVTSSGAVNYHNTNSDLYYTYNVRPSFYLKADVMLDSGTGSMDDPYVVSYNGL